MTPTLLHADSIIRLSVNMKNNLQVGNSWNVKDVLKVIYWGQRWSFADMSSKEIGEHAQSSCLDVASEVE